MKTKLIALTIAIFSASALAESYPPRDIIHTEQSSSSNGFTYPSITHADSDILVNDVVFFYSSDMLDYYDNDVEQLVEYVETSVKLNNDALERQDIPLRRNIAGIVALPTEPLYYNDKEPSREERIGQLTRLYNGLKPDMEGNDDNLKYKFFYDTSYVVALNRHYPDVLSSIGSAEVGGKYSFISPFKKGAAERTLAHELGHNDGFNHDAERYINNKSNSNVKYGIGAECGTFDSIMKSGSGSRSEGFFSSPLVTNSQGTNCGIDNEIDSARAYREAVSVYREAVTNETLGITGTFKNNKPAKVATGTAALSLPNTNITEGQPIIIEIFWSGAELGDSVQVITRQGTAGLSDFKSSLKSIYYNGTDDTNTFSFETFDDDNYELDETLTIEIINPHGVSVADNAASKEVNIISDEVGKFGTVNFSSNALTIAEGRSGTVTLTRTGGSDGEITVNVASTTGTASSDDFTAIDSTITFAQGETSKTVSVFTRSDSSAEPSETFTLTLTGDAQIIGSTNALTVTISASSAPPTGGDSAGGSSGGGSMSLYAGLLLLLAIFRRRKI